MDEKLVEIARFSSVEEGQILVSLLKSEGINCYLRNELTTYMIGCLQNGTARVELLEGDVQQALAIMKEHGYDIPEEDECADQVQETSVWMVKCFPFLKKLPFEKQLIVVLIIFSVLLGVLIYCGLNISAV